MTTLLAILLLGTSLFLILLILIQRGRGGGLAGAFGGMGGQSAFGTKAGDLFTRVTIGVTFFWIVLCIVSVKVMGVSSNKFGGMGNAADTIPGGMPATNPGPAGTGASGGKAPEDVTPGAGDATAASGENSAAPAAGQDKTGGVVPAPGTAGDSGAAGAPVTPPSQQKSK